MKGEERILTLMDLRLQLSEVGSDLDGDSERGAGRRAREAMKGGELS